MTKFRLRVAILVGIFAFLAGGWWLWRQRVGGEPLLSATWTASNQLGVAVFESNPLTLILEGERLAEGEGHNGPYPTPSSDYSTGQQWTNNGGTTEIKPTSLTAQHKAGRMTVRINGKSFWIEKSTAEVLGRRLPLERKNNQVWVWTQDNQLKRVASLRDYFSESHPEYVCAEVLFKDAPNPYQTREALVQWVKDRVVQLKASVSAFNIPSVLTGDNATPLHSLAVLDIEKVRGACRFLGADFDLEREVAVAKRVIASQDVGLPPGFEENWPEVRRCLNQFDGSRVDKGNVLALDSESGAIVISTPYFLGREPLPSHCEAGCVVKVPYEPPEVDKSKWGTIEKDYWHGSFYSPGAKVTRDGKRTEGQGITILSTGKDKPKRTPHPIRARIWGPKRHVDTELANQLTRKMLLRVEAFDLPTASLGFYPHLESLRFCEKAMAKGKLREILGSRIANLESRYSHRLAAAKEVSIQIEGPAEVSLSASKRYRKASPGVFEVNVKITNRGVEPFSVDNSCPLLEGILAGPEPFYFSSGGCSGPGIETYRDILGVVELKAPIGLESNVKPGVYPLRIRLVGSPAIESNTIKIRIKK